MNVTNNMRADWAQEAVNLFREITMPGEEDAFTVVGDLLADLMHFANKEGLDWNALIERATMHYGAEVEEESEENEN